MNILEIIEHLILRHRGDPYHQDDTFPMKGYMWDAEFAGKTLAGFNLSYKISTCVMKIDNKAFRNDRMLEPDSQQAFVAAFNRDVVQPLLERSLFYLRWIGDISFQYPEPWVHLYRLDEHGELEQQHAFDLM